MLNDNACILESETRFLSSLERNHHKIQLY
nr:MAG TPA: hypothetical protein [Caudoviricetes sp.]